jgi:hypothetical protein
MIVVVVGGGRLRYYYGYRARNWLSRVLSEHRGEVWWGRMVAYIPLEAVLVRAACPRSKRSDKGRASPTGSSVAK